VISAPNGCMEQLETVQTVRQQGEQLDGTVGCSTRAKTTAMNAKERHKTMAIAKDNDIRLELEVKTNPVKVIRQKCRDCTCNQITEIENCTVNLCPLWPWRMGKNPYRVKKIMTDEHKERLAKASSKSREKKTVA
jgi:hypothetical protein